MQTNDGLSKVLGELDKFYMKDKDRESFLAYERFTTFRRSEGVSMQDFLIKFELLRNTCSSYEVEIPDKIVAYQMLESANLPMMKKEVVKTTLTTYTADNMRSQRHISYYVLIFIACLFIHRMCRFHLISLSLQVMLPFIVRLYNVISNVTFQVLNSSYLSYLVIGAGQNSLHGSSLVQNIINSVLIVARIKASIS